MIRRFYFLVKVTVNAEESEFGIKLSSLQRKHSNTPGAVFTKNLRAKSRS